MKWLFLLLVSGPIWAQETPKNYIVPIDLSSVCSEVENKQEESDPSCSLESKSETNLSLDNLIASYDSLKKSQTKSPELESYCHSIHSVADSNFKSPLELVSQDDKGNKWTFRFYFGYGRTKYFNTDMHLKSSRVDVEVKDFSFEERTSGEYYNPKNWKGLGSAFQWIDEPSNTYFVNIENKKNVIIISAFHPKFTIASNQVREVKGTVDGVQVDGSVPLVYDASKGNYDKKPGDLDLARFESTHKQMDFQVGYGRKVTLLETKKHGAIIYTPSVQVGVSVGQHKDVYVKQGEYWEFEEYEDKHKIQGMNISAGNRVEYQYGKVGVFVENKLTYGKFKHQFMDGEAKYNMKYSSTTFGVSMKLYETKKKKSNVQEN